MFIAEISPKQLRGLLTAANQVKIAISIYKSYAKAHTYTDTQCETSKYLFPCLQLLIIAGVSISFIIGTQLHWRTLALSGLLKNYLLIAH